MKRALIAAIFLGACVTSPAPQVVLLTDLNSPVQSNVLRNVQRVIDINASLGDIESIVAVDRPQEFREHERIIRSRISADLTRHFEGRAEADTVFLIPIFRDSDLEIQAVGISGVGPDGSYAPRWYLSYYFGQDGDVKEVRGGFVQ